MQNPIKKINLEGLDNFEKKKKNCLRNNENKRI